MSQPTELQPSSGLWALAPAGPPEGKAGSEFASSQRGRLAVPRPRRRRSGEGSGPGTPRRHTHARPRADGPLPRPQVGGPADPAGAQTRLAPSGQARARAHTRTERPVPRRPPPWLARACADTPAGSAPTPTRNKERPVRTRSRGPAPPGRALGAGPAGGGSCDAAREAAELGGPRHILLRLRRLLPGSEPAERSQAEPRAPRARAEQGTEPWRTRRASTVRAGGGRAGGRGAPRRCAPPRLPAAPGSSSAGGEASCSLCSRASPGRHIWGEGAPRAELGWLCRQVPGCGGSFRAVGARAGGGACVCPSMGLCASPGAGAPGCAHLGRCARMFTRLVCTALCVPSWVHTHIHTPGVGCRDTVRWDHL